MFTLHSPPNARQVPLDARDRRVDVGPRDASSQPLTKRPHRRGRLLVECLVAMLLLSVTSLLVGSLTRSITTVEQSARLTTAAWATATMGAERAIAEPCTSTAASGADAVPGVVSQWFDQNHGAWRERDVQSLVTPSALAVASVTALTMHAAWNCP